MNAEHKILGNPARRRNRKGQFVKGRTTTRRRPRATTTRRRPRATTTRRRPRATTTRRRRVRRNPRLSLRPATLLRRIISLAREGGFALGGFAGANAIATMLPLPDARFTPLSKLLIAAVADQVAPQMVGKANARAFALGSMMSAVSDIVQLTNVPWLGRLALGQVALPATATAAVAEVSGYYHGDYPGSDVMRSPFRSRFGRS